MTYQEALLRLNQKNFNTIPQTLEQAANSVAGSLIIKNPKTLAQILSSVAGSAIQYGGVTASLAAQKKLDKIRHTQQIRDNPQGFNIVETNPQFMVPKTAIILVALAALVVYIVAMRRQHE